MKVFTNTHFRGHYPVGTAAVVVAETVEHAAELLEKQLKAIGLPQHVLVEHMNELDTSSASVRVLRDGDY